MTLGVDSQKALREKQRERKGKRRGEWRREEGREGGWTPNVLVQLLYGFFGSVEIVEHGSVVPQQASFVVHFQGGLEGG